MNDLAHILNVELSPDKMGDFTPDELCRRLIELNLIQSGSDMNCMVIEQLQKIIRDGDELPVHYYPPTEEMSAEKKEVTDVECLTDDYIASNLRTD